MAQRYGGKFSPDGDDRLQRSKPAVQPRMEINPSGARANLLFLPAALAVFTSLTGGAVVLASGLAAAAVLTLAALLLREGLEAEAEFNARRVARRPGVPRKLLSTVLTGVGVALAAWRNDPGLLAPLLYGAAASGLHLAAFGSDPLRSKGMEGIDTFQQDRVARAVQEAERLLSAMRDAIRRAGDRGLDARVERFQATARDLFRTIEDDPRDLTGARKYLSVYLLGARDATVKFADIYARERDPQARADYEALLNDLEENFTAQTRKMLSNDHGDLTVEIEVLRERLKREGVRTE